MYAQSSHYSSTGSWKYVKDNGSSFTICWKPNDWHQPFSMHITPAEAIQLAETLIDALEDRSLIDDIAGIYHAANAACLRLEEARDA